MDELCIDAIRQSPRQFVDLETVELLSDRVMVLEQQLSDTKAQLDWYKASYDTERDPEDAAQEIARDESFTFCDDIETLEIVLLETPQQIDNAKMNADEVHELPDGYDEEAQRAGARVVREVANALRLPRAVCAPGSSTGQHE